jgi:hypothetical protein
MVVRIVFRVKRPLWRKRPPNTPVWAATSALLPPSAAIACALGLWSLGADMGLARQFDLSGVFSHWQLWIVLAAVIQLASRMLVRYGAAQRPQPRGVIAFRPNPARRLVTLAGIPQGPVSRSGTRGA